MIQVPDAYWQSVPWPVSVMVIILATAGMPFFLAWLRGQTHRRDLDRVQLVDRETDVRLRERELYVALESQRDDAKAELRSFSAAQHGILLEARADAQRGWDLARDWCSVAHDQRHWINNKLMLIPEATRPHPLPPLPGINRRPGVSVADFPEHFVGQDPPPGASV